MLNSEYIETHENALDDFHYHNLGRQVFAQALQAAREQLGNESNETVQLNMELELSAYEPKDCIKICFRLGDGNWWCVNQQNGEVEERQP